MSEAVWQRAHRIEGFDACFMSYVKWLLRQSFATVWISREPAELPAEGCIIAANHSSWWDGLIPYAYHHRHHGNRSFAMMMSDVELRRFPFFRFGGAFSVDARTPRRAREAIVYAAGLAKAGTCVWIFPEGRIASGDSGDAFGSGFVHAARYAEVAVVPAAMRFVMRSGQRPEAFLAFDAALDARAKDAVAQTRARVQSLLARIDEAIAADTVASKFAPLFRPVSGIDTRVASIVGTLRRWT